VTGPKREELVDAALVARVTRSDPAAFAMLYDRYERCVYVFAAHALGLADAEEVVQDVFLTILHKGDTFEGRAAVSTWVYRITANAALNKRRGKRREVEVPVEEHLPAFEADGHRSGDRSYLLADWSQDPERAALVGETRRVLERGLEALPAHYRAILVLRDVEDLSNEEVAEVIGESVASVKSRLHRARMALREQLTRELAAH
jgi:RNA polymerase sigma-70 factor (ECF subfamily)